MKLKPIHDTILATNGDFGDKTTESGIWVKSNSGTGEGIVPRWFQVFDVGPDITFLKPGQWVLMAHGRWTPHFLFADDRFVGKLEQKVWKLDPEGCLAVSDEAPNVHTINFNTNTEHAQKKSRY